MSDLTIFPARNRTHYINRWFRKFLAKDQTVATDLQTARALLVEAIQSGYVDEETGRYVRVPRFAQTYLATLVRDGDA